MEPLKKEMGNRASDGRTQMGHTDSEGLITPADIGRIQLAAPHYEKN
jgi:hypothetical protein